MYLQKLAQEREHEHRSLDAEKELPQTEPPPSGVFQRVIEMRDEPRLHVFVKRREADPAIVAADHRRRRQAFVGKRLTDRQREGVVGVPYRA